MYGSVYLYLNSHLIRVVHSHYLCMRISYSCVEPLLIISGGHKMKEVHVMTTLLRVQEAKFN